MTRESAVHQPARLARPFLFSDPPLLCNALGRNAMRRLLFVVALHAALAPAAGQSVSAQVAHFATFSGYSTGTAVHAGALQRGTTRLVDSEIAFSGANVNSAGLGAALSNEM